MAPVRVEARTKEQSARDVRRIYADLNSSRVELRSIRGERLFRLGSPFGTSWMETRRLRLESHQTPPKDAIFVASRLVNIIFLMRSIAKRRTRPKICVSRVNERIKIFPIPWGSRFTPLRHLERFF